LPADREQRIIQDRPACPAKAQHIAGGRVSQPEPVNTAAAEATGATQSANVERKLAAILAADVVGYSRLMGLDEEGTHEQLKAHRRELFDPKITEHRGRIVKTTGDGLLVEFASVIDAVRCAVEVQRGMAERNADVDPDRRLDFRIGINLGDIIIDGDDIYGDGVNVAARLEGLAEPGGIYVSRVVRDQVRDKLDFGFEDMGAQSVKNISRPIRVHRVQIAGLSGTVGSDGRAPRAASRSKRNGVGVLRRLFRAPLKIVQWILVLVAVMIVAYRWVNPPVTPQMLLGLVTAGKMEQRWVPLAGISAELPRALIAADDHHFCLHKGVSWDANPDPGVGDSQFLRTANSITMRLAGSLFLWPGSGPVHKMIELPLAYAIDAIWPKPRILEVYLNTASWGSGIYGAAAGAEVMFRKDAAHLSRNEAAIMVAMLLDSQLAVPGQSNARLTERAARVAGKIDQRQSSNSCLR
jgi:class 3 adenylate cyclase